jgi:hypothetical protein
VQHFRRIMVVGRALTRSEQGPLIYSGFDVRHPTLSKAVAGAELLKFFVVFWFWVPEGKRNAWNGRSRVPDVRPFERQALACGELEEERWNALLPRDMPTRAATNWFEIRWRAKCVERLGFLPEAYQSRDAVAPIVMPGAEAAERLARRVL